MVFFFVEAEDGIRDLVRSRGLGDVYKRQRVWDVAFEGNRHATGKDLAEVAKLEMGEPLGLELSLIHI